MLHYIIIHFEIYKDSFKYNLETSPTSENTEYSLCTLVVKGLESLSLTRLKCQNGTYLFKIVPLPWSLLLSKGSFHLLTYNMYCFKFTLHCRLKVVDVLTWSFVHISAPVSGPSLHIIKSFLEFVAIVSCCHNCGVTCNCDPESILKK